MFILFAATPTVISPSFNYFDESPIVQIQATCPSLPSATIARSIHNISPDILNDKDMVQDVCLILRAHSQLPIDTIFDLLYEIDPDNRHSIVRKIVSQIVRELYVTEDDLDNMIQEDGAPDYFLRKQGKAMQEIYDNLHNSVLEETLMSIEQVRSFLSEHLTCEPPLKTHALIFRLFSEINFPNLGTNGETLLRYTVTYFSQNPSYLPNLAKLLDKKNLPKKFPKEVEDAIKKNNGWICREITCNEDWHYIFYLLNSAKGMKDFMGQKEKLNEYENCKTLLTSVFQKIKENFACEHKIPISQLDHEEIHPWVSFDGFLGFMFDQTFKEVFSTTASLEEKAPTPPLNPRVSTSGVSCCAVS